MIRTHVRIDIRDQYIRIFECSNIFVTLWLGSAIAGDMIKNLPWQQATHIPQLPEDCENVTRSTNHKSRRLFIALKCVKSQNQLPVHTIKTNSEILSWVFLDWHLSPWCRCEPSQCYGQAYVGKLSPEFHSRSSKILKHQKYQFKQNIFNEHILIKDQAVYGRPP